MKYTNDQLESMREILAERDLDQSDDVTLLDVFREGCTGWNNFSDEHVATEFAEYYGGDYFDE